MDVTGHAVIKSIICYPLFSFQDRELECKLLSDWSVLLDENSGADQTSQSRLTIVKAVEALATIMLIDPSSCLGMLKTKCKLELYLSKKLFKCFML